MALNLYLDDCSNADLLADLLRQAGHVVVRPNDPGIGLEGADDKAHFAFAAERNLTIITHDRTDFQALAASEPGHFGILGVYQDNDSSRDMSPADIVRAISNLEQAAQNGGDTIEGWFHVLNHWRF